MLLGADVRAAMGRSGRRLVLEKFDVSKIIGEYVNTLISAFERKHGSNSYYCGATEDNGR